jgi:20S proteasome subunit alpha 6
MQSQGSFGRGGMGGGRGGNMNKSGRGGNAGGGNRNMNANRGRGGGMHGGGRGGGMSGSIRGGHSRDRGGFGGNFNRKGGSFASGPHHHNNASFRGGHGGRGGQRGGSGRSDSSFQSRGASGSANAVSMSKREENRRTLTDFKIVAIAIESLGWQWGKVPSAPVTETKDEEELKAGDLAEVKQEHSTDSHALGDSRNGAKSDMSAEEPSPLSSSPTGSGSGRMRIYFHTPPSADDARPIVPSDSRKGKRKKVDDEDGDADDGHRARPPPGLNGSKGEHEDANSVKGNVEPDATMERSSVAPSVAETASEGDWLMAAIAADTEGDGDADADGEFEDYEATQIDGDLDHTVDDGELQIGLVEKVKMRGRLTRKFDVWLVHLTNARVSFLSLF